MLKTVANQKKSDKGYIFLWFVAVDNAPDSDRQYYQYEHWLMKHGEFLEMQVKFLEQQIQKQKRTKKAINARNRQV